MIRVGDTAHMVCTKIYTVYGKNLSETPSIQKMQVDRRSGSSMAQVMVQYVYMLYVQFFVLCIICLR